MLREAMERVRVLLLEVPRLLRDILEQAMQGSPECEVMKDLDTGAAGSEGLPPDVVILGLTGDEDTTLVPTLFARWPRARIMTVGQGDAATLYELRPNRRVLGQISASEMAETLRDVVRRGWDEAGSDSENRDARVL
jgi:DNA-binding NarL/FixJ family response regulator